jgi:transcriptional regulator with XRE-family HTH domain
MANQQVGNPAAILSVQLKELRENMGLTQVELAARLKVTQSFVSKYESGERRLDFIEVYEICGVLHTSIEKFSRVFEDRMRGQS